LSATPGSIAPCSSSARRVGSVAPAALADIVAAVPPASSSGSVGASGSGGPGIVSSARRGYANRIVIVVVADPAQ
jgi:hypothetical protein